MVGGPRLDWRGEGFDQGIPDSPTGPEATEVENDRLLYMSGWRCACAGEIGGRSWMSLAGMDRGGA